ncbi:MAG TPA: hypothetical protein VK737_10160 [Opitutales bacterium]|jgi:hypothetical protein|nr:hypothetical protein [Opitutales bacterium]
MRVWFQRGFAMLLIVAVAVSANLHLPLVQTVAWARMYSRYHEVYSASISLQITFSGQYPCPLCKLVRSAEAEREPMAGSASTSLRLLLPLPQMAALVVVPAPTPSRVGIEPPPLSPAGFAQPELPPPRLA